MAEVLDFQIPISRFRITVPAILITVETIERIHLLIENLGGQMREVRATYIVHTFDFIVKQADAERTQATLTEVASRMWLEFDLASRRYDEVI